MSYWVVHREQVTAKLQIELFEEKEIAELKQKQLRNYYHDVVVLEQKDINELYLQASTLSKKKMLKYEENKNI